MMVENSLAQHPRKQRARTSSLIYQCQAKLPDLAVVASPATSRSGSTKLIKRWVWRWPNPTVLESSQYQI